MSTNLFRGTDKARFLASHSFPAGWNAPGVFPDELHAAAKHWAEQDHRSEHVRHGALQWWRARLLAETVPLEFADTVVALAKADPDEPMGSVFAANLAKELSARISAAR